MPVRCCRSIFRAILLLSSFIAVLAAHAEDWLPITQDELRMTSEPKAPAAPAIYLYRQVDRDDNGPVVFYYARIKILTEEGRKYADVEIPFDKSTESVRGIQARTIHPDGSIANFDGTVFEKPIVQARGVRLLAKTFTLPNVQVGSIIEYRYRHELQSGWVFDSHWVLSQDLFTRYAKYSLDPYRGYALRYAWPIGLPPGTELPRREHGYIRLETHDVPGFTTEEYMPPEDQLKYRVDFIYMETDPDKDPAVFWKKYGKDRFKNVMDFIDHRRVMELAVAQIVSPGDSAEQKLRKLYARTQQIRNLAFERARSAQEAERNPEKQAKNVADVWTRGYGDGVQITWLFLALARAAGLQADPALVSTRDTRFFDPRVMNPADLNSNLVLVKLDGQDLYLDPGVPYTPFGLLPWSETAVRCLRLDKDGGSWVNSPLPSPSQSRTERKATLHLNASGTLEGKLKVTYTGLEALTRRLTERNEDATDRKQFLEDQVRDDVPSAIEVKLTNTPDWNSPDQDLVAEFDLSVPGWAAAAGQRQLLPVGLFSGRDKHVFQHATRIHPLYFSYPYESVDDVTIELPAGRQASSVAQKHDTDIKVLQYNLTGESGEGSLHLHRELRLDLLYVAVKGYDQVRDFFHTVRTNDEEQVVISARPAAQHP